MNDTFSSLHKEFVDYMYPLFGIETNPGYCSIDIRPMIPIALYKNRKIYLRSSEFGAIKPENFNEAEDNVYHEGGHYLREQLFKQLGKKRIHTKRWRQLFLEELIAELSAMVYLQNTRGGEKKVSEYINREGSMYLQYIASDLLKKDETLLKALAGCRDMRNAGGILFRNLQPTLYQKIGNFCVVPLLNNLL